MKRAKSLRSSSSHGNQKATPQFEERIPIHTLKPGDAIHFPKKGDSCLVHYTGFLDNGKIFDSSYNRDRPICIIIGLDQVISGWDDVLVRMSRGQKARVEIPPDMAYGERGYPPVIPPLATLTYELELISFSMARSPDMLERDAPTES
jgi:FK506-binding protein 1